MVAYLEKSEGSEGFYEIIDFLSASHIHYALTAIMGIKATIDRKVKITVLEASIRRHLKLDDSEGIPSLPTVEIFEQLALIGNMNRVSKGYSGVITPLFDTMLVQPQGEEPSIQTTPKTSPSKITSSPSLSSHHTSISALSTSQPPITPTEKAALIPYESPLYSVYSLGRDEGKARRRARIVISEDEDVAEDFSKQGRKISDIDTDPAILLVQPQQDMEYDFDTTASIPVTTTGMEISTANIAVSTVDATVTTASASISTDSPQRVSTAEDINGAETLVYIRRSASKAKDKGKAIMQESEPPKKIKKRVQVQMSIDEELAKKVFEEEEAKAKAEQEQQKFNFKTNLELQRQLDEREEVAAK
ncbi:hypothetical protein Tco_1454809 [Tanacetum coccineum]